MELFAEDWQTLFELLEDGRIKPVIAARFPLDEVVKANELLESGQVTGNVVLLPELEHVSNQQPASQLAADQPRSMR